MKSHLYLLALPTLSVGAAIDVRDTAVTPLQITGVEVQQGDNGVACPVESFSKWFDQKATNATLIFDKASITVGPNTPNGDREKGCILVMSVTFPVGCVETSFRMQPQGYLHFASAANSAHFHSVITPEKFELVNPTNNDVNKDIGGPEYVGDSDKAYVGETIYKIKSSPIPDEKEGKIKFTLRTSVWLDDTTRGTNSFIGFDAIDFSFDTTRYYAPTQGRC